MLFNFLKVAIRNLVRQKFYSFINILGLAVGMIAFIFILLFVRDELSYDRYHQYAKDIYRLNVRGIINDSPMDMPFTSALNAKTMIADFPEVLDGVRMYNNVNKLIKFHEEETYVETELLFADSSIFDVFSISLVNGQPSNALNRPNSLIISQSTATRFFQGENPVGKRVHLFHGDRDYEITAVFQDFPDNSHLQFDAIGSFISLDESQEDRWFNFNYITYLRLAPETNIRLLETKFPDYMEKYYGPEMKEVFGKDVEEMEIEGSDLGFYLVALTDIHLKNPETQKFVFGEIGNYDDVYFFAIIGVFVLFIACINFMNLSTARSTTRAREVGLRKVMGAHRPQLIGQFLMESLLISALALLAALVAVPFLLPLFNELAGKSIEIDYFSDFWMIGTLIILTIITGVLSGFYPAFYLSAFQPVAVMKGLHNTKRKSAIFRSGLVIFQFATTITLVIGTGVVYQQLQYILEKELGYGKEQILVIEDAQLMGDRLLTFKNELLNFPEVTNATITGFLPVQSWRSIQGVFPGKQISPDNMHLIHRWQVDFDYLETLDMEIIAGRQFDRLLASDSSAIILNESAQRKLGITNPIDREISEMAQSGFEDIKIYKIIGVVKDFHFESLKEAIGPLALTIGEANGMVSVRINSNQLDFVREKIEDKWHEMAPDQPFIYGYMEDKFADEYREEARGGKIIGIFSALAIFIACLGLFGLSAYTVERRTKEIGIRKTIGASFLEVVLLLSKDFGKPVMISLLIAIPLSWYLTVDWLDGFTYHTDLSPWLFLGAGFIALFIAWLTVSIQSIKAANINPADALRVE